MKKFSDFSITRKLLTAFLGMVFMILVIGGIGIFGMIRINQMDTYLYKDQTAPIEDLIIATKSLYQFRADAHAMVIHTGDKNEVEALEKAYLTEKNNFLASAESYRSSIKDAEAITLLDESTRQFTEAFDPAIQKCLTAAKSGDKNGALSALSEGIDNSQIIYDITDDQQAHRTGCGGCQ
ncbi:MCP four helix bundle domain-containing protein [Lachnospiraceae bacterium 54-53]